MDLEPSFFYKNNSIYLCYKTKNLGVLLPIGSIIRLGKGGHYSAARSTPLFIESQRLTHHVFILDPPPAAPDKIPVPRVEVDEPKFVKDTYPLLGEDQTDGPPNKGRAF